MRHACALAFAMLLAACGTGLCLAPPASLAVGLGPVGPTGPSEGLDLLWTDESTCETGFEIARAWSGNFSSIATTAADQTRYLDTSVVAPAAGAYCYGCSYRIRAVEEGGASSAWSNVAVSPVAPQPP